MAANSNPNQSRVKARVPHCTQRSKEVLPRPNRVLNPVFHQRRREEDDGVLSKELWKLARKTGALNLSNKGLASVPERIYDINEADEDSKAVSLEQLTIKDDEAWWNQVPLTNLDLSSNTLTQISPKIENLLSLTVLTLHDNSLTRLPPEIGKLEKLMRLNVSQNKLTELPREFYSLPELRHLNISHNEFKELDPDISDLHMLEFLDAGHNNIEIVPGGIGFLVRLTALMLPFNHIKELPSDLVNMRSLMKLDLMHNNLVYLPEDIGMLRKLECVYVQHNDIKMLPDFDGCVGLIELHASNNYIEEIPKAMCDNLPHLKILDLRDNKITELPDEIKSLRKLTRLDVSNNSITVLPTTLASLAHLISLQVEGNPIKSIRRDIIQCGTTRILKTLTERAQSNSMRQEGGAESSALNYDGNMREGQTMFESVDKYKLRHTKTLAVNSEGLTDVPNEVFQVAQSENVHAVDFARNQLTAVPSGLQHLSNTLTELILSRNAIKEIPTFISQFRRITYIELSNNFLSNLPTEFGLLNTLRELNISSNRFTVLPDALYELENLEILIASSNKIKPLKVEGIGKLKRLATLDLCNNDIDYVPPLLGNLTNIIRLELVGNPFRQPRHQILMKGTQSIMSYLRDRIPE